MHHLHVRIRGRVQNVGFRWFARREALRCGVSGVVRNRRDGSVEVEAEGARETLERLVEALRAGPAGAAVQSVETAWSEGPGRHASFEIQLEES